jgi:3-isopropylmalate/(R)-2-methylmalate dehydratase small subunit
MKIESHTTVLLTDNIDTDRIIPARFLTTTDLKGMGDHLFEDWPEGVEALGDARILVAGHNFGCGSSREHAVWALVDRGFQAVIATGFADIFHANSLRNGLVPVIVDRDDHARLTAELKGDPGRPVVLDFETRRMTCGSIDTPFDADAAPTDQTLPGGVELDRLLGQMTEIEAWEADRRPRVNTMETRR